jgi:DnaJ-related protein SCJ1
MKIIFISRFVVSLLIIISNVICDKDLYKILEVQRNASANEIKRKYRELTKIHHPDKNKGNKEASAKFSEIAEAYEILSDPKKRRKYDRGGMEAVNNENQAQNFDPFDIFGNFFGGGGQRGGEKRDNDLKVKIRASLKDLYLGREHEVKYSIFKNSLYILGI